MSALTTQSTTPATIPASTQIAADQVGTANAPATGDRIQYVKLDLGAAGSSAPAVTTVPTSVAGTTNTTGSNTITAVDAVVAAPANSNVFLSGSSTAGSLVAMALAGGESSVVIGVIGGAFTTTLYFEQSPDSTNGTDGRWVSMLARQHGILSTSMAVSTGATNTLWLASCPSAKWVRVRAVGGAVTVAPTISFLASAGLGLLSLLSLPSGNAIIGGTNFRQDTAGTGTILASASKAVGTYTFDLVNLYGKGIRVYQDLTVLGASSVVTYKIQKKDPASGKFLDQLASAATGAGINAVGTSNLTIYPGIAAVANVSASDVVATAVRVSYTVATAASTISLGYEVIP